MYYRTLTIDCARPERELAAISTGQSSAFVLSVKGVPKCATALKLVLVGEDGDEGVEFPGTRVANVWTVSVGAGFFSVVGTRHYEVDVEADGAQFFSGHGLLHVIRNSQSVAPAREAIEAVKDLLREKLSVLNENTSSRYDIIMALKSLYA